MTPERRPGAELGLFRLGRPRVGLLGGSFNPAHAGHRHLSLQALRRLGLDAVWWLVSPQNPLKPTRGMAPFSERFSQARLAARHPRIFVSQIEQTLETSFTAETLSHLRHRFPNIDFVWLMGADNLAQFHQWFAWRALAAHVPIAVLARPGHVQRGLSSVAANHLGRFRLPERRARALATTAPPAWVFLHTPLHPASATRIRAERRRRAVIAGPPAPESAIIPINDHPREDNAIIPQTHAVPAASTGPVFNAFLAPPSAAHDRPRSEGAALVEELLTACRESLEDDKAEQLVVIPLIGRTSLADYMVIASGRSSRQVSSMAEHVARRLRDAGAKGVNTEGLTQGDWVLVDAQDIIVHLFRPEVRGFYNLEKIWGVERPAEGETGGFSPT